MAEQVPPRRARLGSKLRELRARRYRSGSALARALGWGQSRVSKLERATQLPTDDDLSAWVKATGGTEQDHSELRTLLAEARLAYLTYEERWRTPGAMAANQRDIADAEQRAQVIREYQPAMLPGLVQTPAYAKAMLSSQGGVAILGGGEAEIDRFVGSRMERQQLLYTPGKRIRLLIGEAALRTQFGGPDVMAGQMDRLSTLAALDAVELVVLPFTEPYPLIPVSGFSVLDDAMVVIETFSGEMTLEAGDEVRTFTEAFEAGMRSGRAGLGLT